MIAGKYVLRGVNAVEIKKSIYTSISTATIKIPLSVVIRNNDMLQRIKIVDKIKEGDKISVELGYDNKNKLEFEGYIKRINYTELLELECEDEMYILRKVRFKKSFKMAQLSEIINFVLVGAEENGLRLAVYDKMPEMVFSNFIINQNTGIEVLQELIDKHGLLCYLTTINDVKTLYVGLSYTLQKGRVNIHIDKNTVSVSDLKYARNDSEKKIEVHLISNNRNGTKTEVKVGKPGGDTHTLTIPGQHTEANLKVIATAELEKVKRDGYKGSYTCFLIPYVEPGYISNLKNSQFPDRNGTYYLTGVRTTFDTTGAFRFHEIGVKTSV